MKKIILSIVAAMAMNCAMAQEAPAGDNKCKCEQCDCKGKCENCDKKQQRPDRTEMMTRMLNLTPEQAEKVKALNEKYPELMRMHRGGHRGGHGMRGGFGPRQDKKQDVDGTTGATAQQPKQRPSREDMEKRMQEMKKKREAYDAELKDILTKEQFEKYEKNRPQPGQFRNGRGPRR
jgi:hypothetical protein